MPETQHSPEIAREAVEFFKSKLQFEAMPSQLEAIKDKESVLILDVRDEKSFDGEHIKGAVNIPLDELPRRFHELPKEKTVVTYSWSETCPMSARAALDLAHYGYKVQELFGGIKAWKREGRDVEKRQARA